MDFERLIEGAVKFKASDIHIMEGAAPFFRVDGTIVPLTAPPVTHPEMMELLASFLPSRLRQRLEEKRGVDFSYQYKDVVRCRLVAFYERQKLRIVLRLISLKIPTIDELGLSPTLKSFATYNFGMALVTGPTGSGKSSTLAAVIGHINASRKACVITIEDPIEFLHQNNKCIISQREVGDDVGNFNDGLVQALRQDPDVILVGEMRDAETIRTAIHASETGHLVLSTLHTTTAIQTIERILGVFPETEHASLRAQLAANLRAVVTQILVRRIDGKGRAAVQEIMICVPSIAKLIHENRLLDIYGVMKGGEEGMQIFDQSLAALAREKKIAMEEGMKYAHDEFAYKRYIKGVAASSDRGGIIDGFAG